MFSVISYKSNMRQYFCQCFIGVLLLNDLKLIFLSLTPTKKTCDTPTQFFFIVLVFFCQRFKIRFQLPNREKLPTALLFSRPIPPELSGWWHMGTESRSWSHMALWLHMKNLKRNISFSARPMAPKGKRKDSTHKTKWLLCQAVSRQIKKLKIENYNQGNI